MAKGRSSVSIVTILVLGALALGCLVSLGPAAAQKSNRTVSVLALDGISFLANTVFEIVDEDAFERDLPYLEPALRGAWGSFASVLTVPWSGDVTDTEDTLTLIKAFLPVLARNAKKKSQTFVVVGHSWGTLLAYRAIKELAAEGAIKAGDVDQLVTLGSPLTSQVPIIKKNFEKYGDWEGVEPITDVVREWRNYVIEEDLVATVIVDLNEIDNGENIVLPLHTGVIPNKIYAHSQYHENQLFLNTIGLHIRNSTQNKAEPVAQNTEKLDPPVHNCDRLASEGCLASPTPECLIDKAQSLSKHVRGNKDFVVPWIAVAQAEAGDLAEALETLETVNIHYMRIIGLSTIAAALARHGDQEAANSMFSLALDIATAVEDKNDRAYGLSLIARDQAEGSDFAAARRTISHALNAVNDVVSNDFTLAEIAIALGAVGDVTEARKTAPIKYQPRVFGAIAARLARTGNITQALELAAAIQSGEHRVWALGAVAAAQATAGNHSAAKTTLSKAEDAANAEDSAPALRYLAAGQAEAGFAAQALLTTHAIDDPTYRSWALRDIAIAEAKANNICAALETANMIQPPEVRVRALAEIASKLAQTRKLLSFTGGVSPLIDGRGLEVLQAKIRQQKIEQEKKQTALAEAKRQKETQISEWEKKQAQEFSHRDGKTPVPIVMELTSETAYKLIKHATRFPEPVADSFQKIKKRTPLGREVERMIREGYFVCKQSILGEFSTTQKGKYLVENCIWNSFYKYYMVDFYTHKLEITRIVDILTDKSTGTAVVTYGVGLAEAPYLEKLREIDPARVQREFGGRDIKSVRELRKVSLKKWDQGWRVRH